MSPAWAERGAPPTAAWVGAWLALGIVVLPIPAATVVSVAGSDRYEVGYLVGVVGGWLLVIGAALALGCGTVGLVRSLSGRSASGVALSVVPLLVVGLGLFLVFGG